MPFSDIVQDVSGLPSASTLVILTQLSHLTLIKTICHPYTFRFGNAATEHGCKHEKQALATYELAMKERHVNFEVKGCRMFVNQEYPRLHATPHFRCSCDCCGEECGKRKCPTV